MSSVFFPPPSLVFQQLVNMGPTPEEPFPPVNIWETPHDFLLYCSIPHVECEHFFYQPEENSVVVSGYIPEEKGTYVRQERMIGKFSRRIILPLEFTHNISAQINNGIGCLRVPKKNSLPFHGKFLKDTLGDIHTVAHHRERPVTDILALDTGFVIYAEVPGVLAENLRIERTGNSIQIYGRTNFTMKEKASLLTLEFSEVEYALEIALPMPERGEEIQATLKNGVLKIFIPLTPIKEANPARVIPVREV